MRKYVVNRRPPAPPPPPPEKRIYVILPETVQVKQILETRRGLQGGPIRSIPMEAGRLIAQGEHVVSRMRMENIETLGKEPITTINLSVRNSKELDKVFEELLEAEFGVYLFQDTNQDFYQTWKPVRTAICTTPITKEESDPIVGHLERFKARGE